MLFIQWLFASIPVCPRSEPYPLDFGIIFGNDIIFPEGIAIDVAKRRLLFVPAIKCCAIYVLPRGKKLPIISSAAAKQQRSSKFVGAPSYSSSQSQYSTRLRL